MKADYWPLYRHTHGDAVRLREEALWEQSFRENVACARAIEKALRGEYARPGFIPIDCAEPILKEFGHKRVSYVLASTVLDLKDVPTVFQQLDEDTRHWAKGFGIVPDREFGRYYCVDTATVLLDAFIQQTRDAYQALRLFDGSQCVCGMYQENVKGKVLVMKPDTLKESYWSQENQLWLAEDGFGCDPSSSGRAIYATCLSDGERTRWNREDFLGVLDERYLPEWAKPTLEELRAQEQEHSNAPAQGEMKMC